MLCNPITNRVVYEFKKYHPIAYRMYSSRSKNYLHSLRPYTKRPIDESKKSHDGVWSMFVAAVYNRRQQLCWVFWERGDERGWNTVGVWVPEWESGLNLRLNPKLNIFIFFSPNIFTRPYQPHSPPHHCLQLGRCHAKTSRQFNTPSNTIKHYNVNQTHRLVFFIFCY